MEDPHRQPKDRDRSQLIDRIQRAADEGRIGIADRDIRLGNVRSAQSMSELNLITRDLDLLEQTLAPGTVPAPLPVPPVVAFPPAAPPAPPSAPSSTLPPAMPPPDPAGATVNIGGMTVSGLPGGWTAGTTETVIEATKAGAKRIAVAFIVILVLAVAGAGAAAFFVFGSSSSDTTGELFDPETISPTATEDPSGPSTGEPGSDPSQGTDPDLGEPSEPYALTGPGIRAFLAAYQAKFRTTRVVSLTLYDGYAIAQVPVPGKNRHAGWLYRPGQGWGDFGGVSANFPGSAVVDTTRLDIAALLRNIERARRTLNVEEYSLTYVNIDYRPQFDDGVNVNIYVSNEFQESGYLATTLDGRIERAYPFGG